MELSFRARRLWRLRGLLLAAGMAAVVVAGCGGSTAGGSVASTTPPPAGVAATVDIRNIAFHPTSVAVHVGQTVAWHFDDGTIPHNVMGSGWSSPDRTSGFYTHTFTAPGTYDYRCTIHSGMTGVVVVTP